MVLVDTSVWVDHFRSGNLSLRELLEKELVLVHPFVIGELACGNLRHRAAALADLRALPYAHRAEHEEVLALVERRKLWERGLGWVDAHLLAASMLTNCTLWTLDKALSRAAASAGIAHRF